MSMLRTYIDDVMKDRGLSRQARLANLREYLKVVPIGQLEIAISDLTDVKQLRILWEAGLKPPLNDEVLRRHEELTARRGE